MINLDNGLTIEEKEGKWLLHDTYHPEPLQLTAKGGTLDHAIKHAAVTLQKEKERIMMAIANLKEACPHTSSTEDGGGMPFCDACGACTYFENCK